MTTVNQDEVRFRSDIWKDFFTTRTAKQWSRLPTEAMWSPSLEVSMSRLDKTLSNPL